MTTQTKGVTPAFKHAIGAGFDRTDYSVVVKNRARLPKPWRWEIYRAGRQSPVEHSREFFDLRSTANVEGKAALSRLMEHLKF
jgi:hypothetical protein